MRARCFAALVAGALAPSVATVTMGCASRPMSRAEEEANLVGRVVEARSPARYVLTRNVVADRGPTLVVARYVVDDTTSIDVACSERTEPPCWLVGTPPLNLDAPSAGATELVALVEATSWMMGCSDVSRVEALPVRNATLGRTFVVRACGRKFAFDVKCSTNEPTAAHDRCVVTGKNAVVELDAARHPDVRFRRCANGYGYGVLEPTTTPLDDASLRDHFAELGAYFRVLPFVRQVELRECCSDEDPARACLAVFVTPRVDADGAVDAIASALGRIRGDRPRVVIHNAMIVGLP